jgi:Dolichyl-phosphate-mannose-protein mannosyltransferase
MWTLNGLLLVFLAFAIRRAFGSGVALGTMLFLAIDPTVAAHLPVVMTDLPVSLLSATAVVLAIRAFQSWQWQDLAACASALGLALATKHSAPIVLIFVLGSGTVLAVVLPLSWPDSSRLPRFVKLAAVAIGALIILWSFYFFRFAESDAGHDVFNRPLADKISDVRSPAYFFSGVILLKLPIGLDLLVLIGLFFLVRRHLSPESTVGLSMVLAASAIFLVVLASSSTYAGIRQRSSGRCSFGQLLEGSPCMRVFPRLRGGGRRSRCWHW